MSATIDRIDHAIQDFANSAPTCQILVTTPVKGNSKQREKSSVLEMSSFTTAVFQRSRWLPGAVKAKKIIAPDCEEYLFTRPPDQASAELKLHCILGDVLPEVKIEIYTVIGDTKPAVVYTLSEAIVTQVRLRVLPGSNPMEHIGFAARKTKWEYAGPDGIPSAGGFDWLEMKKWS